MDHLLPLDMAPGSPLLPNSNSKPTTTTTTTTKRSMLAFGILLVIIQLVCQQAQNEMFRYQETNTTFSVPVEGIYMNHTWLVWMFLGAWVLCCYKRTKTWCTSPINPLQKFIKNALKHCSICELICKIIVLEWIMFVPNVAWTMSVERVSVTLSIATQQSTCVFVYLFTLCCFKEITQNKKRTSKMIPAFAVISCLFGVVLVYFGEEKTGDVGDGKISNYLLLSVNPVFIAVFDLIFTKWSNIICQDVEDIMCLMGFMGIACCTTCWPALLIDDSAFQLPWPRTMNGYCFMETRCLQLVLMLVICSDYHLWGHCL